MSPCRRRSVSKVYGLASAAPGREGGELMAATTRPARRRLLPALAAAGLLAACGLTLAPGPAAHAQSRLTP